jgi:hypothetical protein
MKKGLLLLLAFAYMATVTNAQDGLKREEGFFWKYDDVNKTATVISSERWHWHGDQRALGNCHCYRDDVVIPEKAPNGYTVTGIGEGAFNSCDSLTSIKLPSTLKTIGVLAFQLCTELKEIRIPASVEVLGEACLGASGIERCYIEDSSSPISIWDGGFVYGSLFMGIPGLKYVYVGRDFTVRNLSAEETGGPMGLFYQTTVEDVEFGPKVTRLHTGEFFQAQNVKNVNVGNVAEIPDQCFGECSTLVLVVINHEKLTAIGNYAFSHAYATGVNLDLSMYTKLKTIGEGAFMEANIMSAIIPASVESVGENAFGFNPSLSNPSMRSLTCLAVVPPTTTTFGPVSEDMYKTCKLYVPEGCTDAYKAATGWKNFFSVETGIGSIKSGIASPDNSAYDLQGRRQTGQPRSKGLYIVGGKKMLAK